MSTFTLGEGAQTKRKTQQEQYTFESLYKKLSSGASFDPLSTLSVIALSSSGVGMKSLRRSSAFSAVMASKSSFSTAATTCQSSLGHWMVAVSVVRGGGNGVGGGGGGGGGDERLL